MHEALPGSAPIRAGGSEHPDRGSATMVNTEVERFLERGVVRVMGFSLG